MDRALVYTGQHPSESYSDLSEQLGVPDTIIMYRYSGTQPAQGENTIQHVSTIQKDALVGCTMYANRGTLLTINMTNSLLHASVGTIWAKIE